MGRYYPASFAFFSSAKAYSALRGAPVMRAASLAASLAGSSFSRIASTRSPSASSGARGATSGRQDHDTFARMLAARSELDPEDESYYAQMVRANTQPHRDWLAASNRRHQMRLAWAEFFRDWDVLLCPNAASAAFRHSMPGERWERMIPVNGGLQPATTQMWWAGIAGMCYLPGTAAPIGLSPEGLPLSVQIVGPQHGDLTTLRVAQLIEREYYAFAPPPAYA